jgi:hypothetical protein
MSVLGEEGAYPEPGETALWQRKWPEIREKVVFSPVN